jgi:hypothetical protein
MMLKIMSASQSKSIIKIFLVMLTFAERKGIADPCLYFANSIGGAVIWLLWVDEYRQKYAASILSM